MEHSMMYLVSVKKMTRTACRFCRHQSRSLQHRERLQHLQGGRLGFLLEHQYADSLQGLSDSMFPGVLKGHDRLLYAAVKAVGLDMKMVPVHKTWCGCSWLETVCCCKAHGV